MPGAGPEPDAQFAQTETPEPSAPIAVAVLATQLLTEAPIVEASAPVKASSPTPPTSPPMLAPAVTVAEAPRPSPERSAEAATKPVPTVTAPEPPPTLAPAVTVAEAPRPSPERSAEATPKPVPTVTAPEPPPRLYQQPSRLNPVLHQYQCRCTWPRVPPRRAGRRLA